jgi:hypothetical protein
MKRDTFEKMLNKYLPKNNIEIINYNVFKREKFDDNDWITDSPTIFVDVRYSDISINIGEINKFFEDFTPFSFVINKV